MGAGKHNTREANNNEADKKRMQHDELCNLINKYKKITK